MLIASLLILPIWAGSPLGAAETPQQPRRSGLRRQQELKTSLAGGTLTMRSLSSWRKLAAHMKEMTNTQLMQMNQDSMTIRPSYADVDRPM